MRNGKAIGALICVAVAATVVVLVAIRDEGSQITISEVRLQSDDRTLELGLNSCNADPSVAVDESTSEVVLDVRGNPTNDDCADQTRVRLSAPLGDRSIIDAATGRELQPIAAS